MESITNKKRYIVIHDTKGIFLGTYSIADIFDEGDIDPNISEEDLYKTFALFADENPLNIPRAISFNTREEATDFCNESFNKIQMDSMSIVQIESGSQYPDVTDIIKSGYGDYTFDMLDGLELTSQYIH